MTWYRFDTVEELTHVRTMGAGATAIVRAGAGEIACAADASANALTYFAPAGTSLCVAVESGSAVSGLAIESIDYHGAGVTPPVPLAIERPSLEGTRFEGFSITGDDFLAVSPTTMYQNMGTAGLMSMPRAGGARSSIRFDVDGRVLGRAAWTLGEALYVIEQTENTARFYRLIDASGAWRPAIWDARFAYDDDTVSLTYDGTSLYAVDYVSSSTATRDSIVYRFDPAVAGPPALVGRVNTVYAIGGMAADAEFFYFAASTSSAAADRGVYRVRRADVEAGTGTPVRIAQVDVGTLTIALRLDDLTSPDYLYVRDTTGSIRVIGDPGGATPRLLGTIFRTTSADNAMDLDRATGALYFFDSDDDPEGAWYRLDP